MAESILFSADPNFCSTASAINHLRTQPLQFGMALSTKKKAKDDFVFTISDNEDDSIPNLDEEIPASPPPSKKRKRNEEPSNLTSKKTRKNTKNKTGNEEEVVDENEGIWGVKDDDDGAMDPDFEFALDDNADTKMDEFEGWGLESAKKAFNGGDKKGVDIDEIIARRREKKNGGRKAEIKEAQDTGSEADNDVESDADLQEDDLEGLKLNNDDDEFMAEDGFGMGVASGEEESGDEEVQEAEGNLDDDSIASPVPHPDDLGSEGSSDEEDDGEDPEEAAKAKAFYAPAEKPAKKSQSLNTSSFQGLKLSRPILRGLAAVGFSQPTPIQAKTIPVALGGQDVVGGAVTGSGKTAAFIVPVLERLLYRPKKVPTSRVAILMPTRELAIQCHAVATKLASHTDIKFCLAVGGLSLKVQEAELRLRPDVIIATPGRFIDHMRNSPSFTVDTLEILVLDEADRMLEAGFADELNEILTTIPKSRQTMLFSATMTSSVDNLIRVGLNRPVRLMVDSQKQTVGTLVQEFIRLRPGRETKRMGYLLYLCKNVYTDRVIVFFRQKKEAHRARIIVTG